jgi:arabinofuranan 3-O-arabinosyltransferase
MNGRMEPLPNVAAPGRQSYALSTTFLWDKLLEIEEKIFTQRRILFYGSGVVVAYAIALAWQLFFVLGRKQVCYPDFCWEWVAGVFAVNDPSRIFDFSAFSNGELTRLVGPPDDRLLPLKHFLYPPTFLFFLYPLGLMPYLQANLVWIVGTLLFYLAAVYAIIPRTSAMVAALTPFVVTENVLLGHNGFLTAGFMGLSLLFLGRSALISGIFLGLLTFKPHFGILFVPALLAARNWRALASATVASLIFAVAAGIAFGAEGWSTFVTALFDRNSTLGPAAGYVFVGQSLFGLLNWLGASPRISWGVHLAVAAVVVVFVFAVWARSIPYSLKAAALCIGTVIVNPHVQRYDLCVLSIGIAFLVKDGLSRGFLAGERTLIVICFAGSFIQDPPIDPLIYLVMALLILRRIVAYRNSYQLAPITSKFFESDAVAGRRALRRDRRSEQEGL